ncbi:hypothetical protein [Pseudoduganella lutea]|uniref:PQQ-binding-like beta-propeller repeat protein n=1 Tax=Pseudoduganella lutea TaxID=321985 RepID=A0A4P6L0C8_9BURK|nr:hypothetical protein [Pseudoduganella lutea]QBE64058.1 hypothetical protein EWM63_14570 [Pseudoduganella lutea]
MRKNLIRLPVLAALISLVAACGGGGGGDTASGTPAVIPPLAPIIDTDKDGVADANDVAPADAACASASDASGGVCYVRTLVKSRLRIVGNAEGKIFFSAEEDALRLYSYDLKTRHFLGRVDMAGFTPAAYAYVPAHGKLYVGDDAGKIRAYSESLQQDNAIFATVKESIGGMAAAGQFLIVQDSSGAWATHSSFDKRGTLADSKDWNYYSRHYEWAPGQARLYFFRDHTPNDLMFEVIDQATGKITSSGETPYHGSYDIAGPIRANEAGSKIILGTGDIYDAPSLTWSANIGKTFADAAWIGNNELLVLTADRRLRRYDSALAQLEELPVNGEVLALAASAGTTYLVTRLADQLAFVAYKPSNDSDGDGYANTADKFPLDKTAAVDSDNDGFPDAFLNGYGATDSTTGLTVDAYPHDAACHAAAEGNGTACNYTAVIPSYMPDRVLADNGDTVYLLSVANKRVYRWSKSRQAYIAPLVVGQQETPTLMAYSADHNRLYFGHDSGSITYVDLAGDPVERKLASTAGAVRGLAAAGKYLLAQDPTGAWATHYVFDKAGTLASSKDWNYYSGHYEWNANQSRMYFFRDDTSPNDLMYETIDQATGQISGAGDSPYHGELRTSGPIRVSGGGGRIVIGSGVVLSPVDLMIVKNLGKTFMDAQWRADGSLVTLAATGARSNVTWYDTNLNLVREQSFEGTPMALVRAGDTTVVVTQLGNAPSLSVLP